MKQVAVNYPDQTGKIVDTLIADFNQNYRKAHQPAIESLVPADNH
jgi:hypothetical protein